MRGGMRPASTQGVRMNSGGEREGSAQGPKGFAVWLCLVSTITWLLASAVLTLAHVSKSIFKSEGIFHHVILAHTPVFHTFLIPGLQEVLLERIPAVIE